MVCPQPPPAKAQGTVLSPAVALLGPHSRFGAIPYLTHLLAL